MFLHIFLTLIMCINLLYSDAIISDYLSCVALTKALLPSWEKQSSSDAKSTPPMIINTNSILESLVVLFEHLTQVPSMPLWVGLIHFVLNIS